MIVDRIHGRLNAQKGTTVVEFSIAASVFFLILFSVIEFGRVMYTWHLLQECTRSAARVAVVSEWESPDILKAARQFMPTLAPEHLAIDYLTVNGNPAADRDATYFVTASITDFDLTLLIPIPGLDRLPAPPFTTTQIAESLGRDAGEKAHTL